MGLVSLGLLLGVCSFNLRLNEPFKRIVNVPARAKPLALPHLYDYLICRGSAQREYINPRDPREKFSNLFIGLLVALFITLAEQGPPKGAICAHQVLLNGAGADSENRRVRVAAKLFVCQHRV